MKIYTYEGKNLEELTLQALKELEVKEEEMLTSVKEENVGLLKKKKYTLSVVLKSDVLTFSKEYLKTLVEGMGVKVNFETLRKDNYLKIILHPDNSSILIGKEGRTLSSIQNVLRAVLTKETGMHINIILDVENYKEKSQKHIERLAKNLAKEVQKTKEPVRMDSMNSYERRPIHEVLKDFKGITTESEGEEPNRAVVIKPVE